MTWRLRHVAPALALALAFPPTASAFNRGRSNWNPASLPISYRINLSSVPASLGAAAAQAAIEGGMASWSAPTCTRWRAVNAGTTAVTRANASDRENSFLWISGAWPAELGAVNTTIGITSSVWTSGGYFSNSDIQFNNVGFSWSTTGARGTVDTQSIATHEEGHFLGLDHTTVRGSVMLASYGGGILRTLSSDDIAGVCTIYPSGGAIPDAGAVPSDPCAAYTSCAGCTPVNNCGWCGATGRCATGTPSGPSGGSCGGGYAWQPSECSATTPPPVDAGSSDPCSRYTSCDTCAPVNPCGWCGATGRCASGTPRGPSSGTCGGNYVWDPAACGASPTPDGTAQFGEPCRGSGDCASGGPCINLTNASGVSVRTFCTQVCIDDCTCPRGYRCGVRLSNGQMLCIPGTNSCPAAPPDASVPPLPDASVAPPDVSTRPDVTAPIDRPVATDAPVVIDMPTPPDTMVTMKTDAGVPDDIARSTPDVDDEAASLGAFSGASRSGCGCDVPGRARSSSLASLLGLVGAALTMRRRRARA